MAHDAKHKKSRKGGAAKMILIVLLILWLALKIATSPATNDDLRSEPISFWASFGLQFVNVKSFCTALPRYPRLYYRTLRTHTG